MSKSRDQARFAPYPPTMWPSLQRVMSARRKRIAVMPELDPQQRADLLGRFHPDFKTSQKIPLSHGPNSGEPAPIELAHLLAAPSRVEPGAIRLDAPAYDVDVLVIGGGGAAGAAALAAHDAGCSVMVATKLRFGDSNTVMAGGIACAVDPADSPVLHFLDTMEAGKFFNRQDLVDALVRDAPEVIGWLESLGVLLTKTTDRELLLGRAGGHSRHRIVTALGGIAGVGIIRVLAEELALRKVPILEFHPAVETVKQQDRCGGAILECLDTHELKIVRARCTVLATGGLGRLHCAGHPTTNHYGATGDGLPLAYRSGARLEAIDSLQYHPTAAVWPEAAVGWLASEGNRGAGALLLNAAGERFVSELATRDVVAAAIIRECEEGRGVSTPSGRSGVWLDVTAGGAQPVERGLEYNRFKRLGIDCAKLPLLIYPALHYQNGGILIDADGRTTVEGLYAAGEVAGGVHGRNRLGGNSLLDVLVFGRRAGRHAARHARAVTVAPLSLDHVVEHNRAARRDAPGRSPMLLPDYARAQHDSADAGRE